MSDAKKELTPEEKLLELIQRDKRQDVAAPAKSEPVVPVKNEPVAPAAPVAPRKPVVSEEPVTLQTAAPVAPGSAPANPPRPLPEAQPAEKKLKLSERSDKPVASAASVTPTVPDVKAPAAQKEAKPTVQPEPKVPPVQDVASEVTVEGVAAAFASTKPQETPGSAARPRVLVRRATGGLALVNRMLALVVLVLLVMVVYSVASIRSDVDGELQKVLSAGSLRWEPLTGHNAALPPLEQYLARVSGRDIFMPLGVAATTNVVTVTVGKVGDLKLVGISADEAVPDESLAIIRNKVEAKTYFVKIGQTVGDTGLTLARVLTDRVVLKSQKQEVELK